jgi:chromosome segregation ATPase
MIELTLNYENKRADEEIDDTFNNGDLEKFCEKNFGIDINKYDIQFYYFDKKSNQKTPIIPDCISSFYDPYKFNKGNNDRLMLYVETKLKEDLQKKLEEAKNEYTKICKDIDSLNKENDELEKEIKNIKELIEQEIKRNEENDDDDEKELNEYESKKENLEKRIKEMESEKIKEIEDLKEENLKLENMIADLSLKLSKQKEENQNLKKDNENLQKNINELNQDQINSSSLSFNSNELSLSNANFFSDKNEIQNYMGNNENKIKQKEKKKERLTKINELYQKMKNDNTKFKLRKKDTSELGLRSSNSLSLSRVNSRISGEIKNNKKVENIQLKKDITALEEKINSTKNEIENLKTKHENQVKNIKNTQI